MWRRPALSPRRAAECHKGSDVRGCRPHGIPAHPTAPEGLSSPKRCWQFESVCLFCASSRCYRCTSCLGSCLGGELRRAGGAGAGPAFVLHMKGTRNGVFGCSDMMLWELLKLEGNLHRKWTVRARDFDQAQNCFYNTRSPGNHQAPLVPAPRLSQAVPAAVWSPANSQKYVACSIGASAFIASGPQSMRVW